MYTLQPLVVPALLADIRDVITRSKLVVSIAAGVTCSTIEEVRVVLEDVLAIVMVTVHVVPHRIHQ